MRSFAVTVALSLGLAATSASAALKAGDPAPAFTLQAAQGGKTFTFDLAAALAKGPVVLYFYPKSFTSVCTQEAHDFAENMKNFQAAGASVIGVSGDGIATQREFSSKECRDKFPVGADPDFTVIRAYDVAMALPGTNVGYAQRTSFVITPDKKVLYAYSDMEADNHIKNALAAVRSWRAQHPR